MKTKLILVVVLALCVFTQIAGAKTAVEWYNEGYDLDKLGRYEEAIKAYDKALGIDPTLKEAWHNKGVTLANLGRYEEAIDAFDKALEIDPTYKWAKWAWYNKGSDFGCLGRYEEAMRCYDKALEIDSNHEEESYNKDLARKKLEQPGFEAVFAIAGLLAVAYLLRRRK